MSDEIQRRSGRWRDAYSPRNPGPAPTSRTRDPGGSPSIRAPNHTPYTWARTGLPAQMRRCSSRVASLIPSARPRSWPAGRHPEGPRALAQQGNALQPDPEARHALDPAGRRGGMEEVEGLDLDPREARLAQGTGGPEAAEGHLVGRDPEVPLGHPEVE